MYCTDWGEVAVRTVRILYSTVLCVLSDIFIAKEADKAIKNASPPLSKFGNLTIVVVHCYGIKYLETCSQQRDSKRIVFSELLNARSENIRLH